MTISIYISLLNTQTVDYTIDISDTLNSVRFRLQKDRTWRPIETVELTGYDFVTENAQEAMNRLIEDQSINLNGKQWRIEPDSSSLGDDDVLYYDVRCHRSTYPALPSFDQMMATIANGDDNVANVLVMTVDGKYELRTSKALDTIKNDPSIVLRHEMFQAHGGYVGATAGKDRDYYMPWWETSLTYWLRHIETGKTCMFSDYNTRQNMEELIAKINTITG